MTCNTKKDLSKIIVKEDLLTVDLRELTVSLEALKFATPSALKALQMPYWRP